MKIGLFLGAGASAPFGMPPTREIKSLLHTLSSGDREDEILRAILNDYHYPDLEYVLQAVRDIREFAKSLGGQYFFTHGKGIFSLKNGQIDFNQFINLVAQVEVAIEDFVYENYRWKPAAKQNVLDIFDKIFGFLSENSDSINVFSTNYDRIIEEYCNVREKYKLADGFERLHANSEYSAWTGKYDEIFSDFSPNIIHLYKLHGSLNWKEHVENGIIRTLEESKPTDSNFKRNLVIMPTLSPKEEEEAEPFKTIISEFINYMNKADACIVIGFSFRDHRINDVFKSFVKKGKTLVIISPSAMKNSCENLFKVDLPKDFDPGRASWKVPIEGNVWCISGKLDKQNIEVNLNSLALAHIKQGLKDKNDSTKS